MGSEHYLSKLERNIQALDIAPEDIRENVIKNIRWARGLIGRLDTIDYPERDKAIRKIHEVLDQDYESMGFSRGSLNGR